MAQQLVFSPQSRFSSLRISENLWASLSISGAVSVSSRFFCFVWFLFLFFLGLGFNFCGRRHARLALPRVWLVTKLKAHETRTNQTAKYKNKKKKKPKKRERKKEKKMAAQRANNKRNSHVPRPQWSPFSDFVSFFLLFNQLWRICHRIVVGLLSFHRPTWSFVRFSLFLSLH